MELSRSGYPPPMERVCNAFRQNQDGSWTCTQAVTFSIPGGQVGFLTDQTFKPGETHSGFDVAGWLTQHCESLAKS